MGINAKGPADMIEDIQRDQANNTNNDVEENGLEDIDASMSFSLLHSPRRSQLCPVDCRTLRQASEATTATATRQEGGAADTISTAMPVLASSNYSNSSTTRLLRGLSFILASGPSKRGPGH
ncbi:hypothetical protein BUALT_Bualt01G0134700 [Buddleja alternifolia]|uniref:Uncharacterized protein n=1 Tax=Buddleja alternifolia TaxID=168488 RepID=A0AAV6Y7T9_9LAMI|nr:hypothetical protein BUALT_Bualt01G0134700 [Buddleja alternifolia]